MVILTLGCLLTAWAQTTSTAISGTAVDSTGAVIPDAEVTLLRIQTVERRETRTTEAAANYEAFPLSKAS